MSVESQNLIADKLISLCNAKSSVPKDHNNNFSAPDKDLSSLGDRSDVPVLDSCLLNVNNILDENGRLSEIERSDDFNDEHGYVRELGIEPHAEFTNANSDDDINYLSVNQLVMFNFCSGKIQSYVESRNTWVGTVQMQVKHCKMGSKGPKKSSLCKTPPYYFKLSIEAIGVEAGK